ncbi:MAG: serine protein kinase RIO [Nitrososphaerota archaeon]|nr:serine protein kinase RIO [Nitrososphaerota archaeon]
MREEQLRERLLRFERESRYLKKDSNERKVFEEVFDRATLWAIDHLLSSGQLDYLNGVVNAGKEARVYWGVAPDGSARAVKIYLTASAEFKKRLRYVAGDRRFNKIPSTSRGIAELWVQKEFKNLQLAQKAGVRVPTPYAFNENVLVMEYIGEPPAPAPRFIDTEVGEADYRWAMEMIEKLYRKAQLVHADLSEYNVFKLKEECVLFDMGSAVLTTHPEARELLLRDVANMVRFFKRRGIFEERAEEIVERIVS